jgi:predicted PurR-regulated permease PerM
MSDEPLPLPDAQPDETISTAGTAQWPEPLRYGVGLTLIAIVAAGFVLVLPLLQVILFSFLIAFIMFIPSRSLSKRTRLPYGLAVGVSFIIAAVLFIGLVLVLVPEILRAVGSVRVSIEQAYAQLAAAQADRTLNTIVQIAGVSVPVSDIATLIRQLLPIAADDLLSGLAHLIFGLFGNMASLIAAVGTASVVALFFLIDLPISSGTMTTTIPAPYRREIALLFGKLDVLWLKFFRALMIVGVITGAASLSLFVLFGLEGALLLAVVTATIRLIPVIGRIFAILLVFAAALINGSTRFVGMDNFAFAVLTFIAYLIVTEAISTLVSPKLKGSAIEVPTVAIVVGVMVGLATAGIVGAVLIVPIIGSLRVFMKYAIAKILLRDPYPNQELPPLQHEGFFSHMLYVKKKKEAEA